MKSVPDLVDLQVFLKVARRASFTLAADEMGLSTGYVSKRIRLLEERMGVKLLHRSTRVVSVTDDGERIYAWALRIFEVVEQMEGEIDSIHDAPSGSLKVITSPGLGRKVVGPGLSLLAQRFPDLDIRLDIEDRIVDLVEEGVDLDIRVGNQISPNLIAKRLMPNHRVLCVSPAYLKAHDAPATVNELASHECLIIKERDHPFGVWALQGPEGQVNVKVTGALSTNHGEIARQWCLDGRGVLFRSHWDVAEDLASGRLVRVLPGYAQTADIWAVHASPLIASGKVRVAVEFLREYFASKYASILPVSG
ncbi:LysR substrate-binding domain-containing protein [Pseudomonas putida]